MAAFGGALVGGLVEVLTDRSPGSALAAQTPVATPTTSQVTTAAQATVPPATASVTAPATSPEATATPTASPPPTSVEGGFAEHGALVAALTALPRGKNVAFGVGVLDAATGRRFVFDVGAPFEMASTVKVDILVATFLRAADAGRGLTAGEKSLASVMIRNSDNAAASTLFRAAGRAPGMAKAYQRMGMTATKAPSAWGLTTTTPGDRLVVLEALARGGGALTAEAGAEILALMRSVTTSQRWGVGGVARAGETVAVKNGWLPRSNQGGSMGHLDLWPAHRALDRPAAGRVQPGARQPGRRYRFRREGADAGARRVEGLTGSHVRGTRATARGVGEVT